MPLIGAFARIDHANRKEAIRRLDELEGVETFDLDDPDKVGLLIEAPNLDRAHEILTGIVRGLEGALGVWPVYVHDEGNPEEARQAVSRTVE